MEPYLNAVMAVTNAREPIRSSIRQSNEDLLKLLDSDACRTCTEFHKRYASQGIPCTDEREATYRGGILLFTVAALQCGEHYREQLILQGARGVEAHGALKTDRRRKAAAARPKPLRDIPWYVTNHLRRVQQQMADELRVLAEHPRLLNEALNEAGELALSRYM